MPKIAIQTVLANRRLYVKSQEIIAIQSKKSDGCHGLLTYSLSVDFSNFFDDNRKVMKGLRNLVFKRIRAH